MGQRVFFFFSKHISDAMASRMLGISPIQLRQRPDKTISFDLDEKYQHIQTNSQQVSFTGHCTIYF